MDNNERNARNHIAKLNRFTKIVSEKNIHIKEGNRKKYILSHQNSLNFQICARLSNILDRIQEFFLLGVEVGIKCAELSAIQSVDTQAQCKNSCIEGLSSLKPEDWTLQDLSRLMDIASLMTSGQLKLPSSSNNQKHSKELTTSDQQQSSHIVEQQQVEQNQKEIEITTHLLETISQSSTTG